MGNESRSFFHTILFGLVAPGLIGLPCYGERHQANDHLAENSFVVVTFNTGTTLKLRHQSPSHDAYNITHANISDRWYGNGLAWRRAIEAVRRFVRSVDPDIISFQEMFYPENCLEIPEEEREGFICEDWAAGDPSVARMVMGDDYQIAYHPNKPNKCLAVHPRFGTIRGYDTNSSENLLEGAPVKDCGSGARVARAIIDRPNGEEVTVITIHGTSGIKLADQECRVRQVERIFVDFGDGQPGVRDSQNLILGDFNTDPIRAADADRSASRWNDFVGPGKSFHFISKTGLGAPRAYQGIADIDHVVSDTFDGTVRYPGVDEDSDPVFRETYFDHVPVVCTISKSSETPQGVR